MYEFVYHSIVSCLKSQAINKEFDHLIAHALSCTLESKDVIVMGYERSKFGSLDEMIKVDDLMCLIEGKEAFKKEFKVP